MSSSSDRRHREPTEHSPNEARESTAAAIAIVLLTVIEVVFVFLFTSLVRRGGSVPRCCSKNDRKRQLVRR
ncbi:hypothetical protein C9J85_18475 [Haloferax sp. wsp5]|nr:hypothetical protein C9J85_18475 [Haloferax sp. wsp5]